MTRLAGEIQMRLLKYRFNAYRRICPAVIPESEGLRPRSKDLLASLAAPVAHCRLWNEFLLEFFRDYHDLSTRESLKTKHDAILAVLFVIVRKHPDLQTIRITNIREMVNTLLDGSGERISLSDRAVGAALSTLGFRNKRRTNEGWVLSLDSPTVDRIHQLHKTYGSKFVGTFAI